MAKNMEHTNGCVDVWKSFFYITSTIDLLALPQKSLDRAYFLNNVIVEVQSPIATVPINNKVTLPPIA